MIYRISKMPIVLVMQPNFVRNWDYDDNDMYERNLGKYAGLNNRYKDILDAGINLAFSSDSMPMSPLYGIGKITSYKRESQRISFEQALDCYTRIAAKAIRRNDIGIIQNGKKADFTIINNNKENIESTIVNGITVFSKE
jgi:predicted amidohydrolase YtcJ